ncbi:MAG: TAT-variant-translocated molybdopterin oxidoreductase, partial [Candidatus Competibacteraceae bacterium]|nr:TAT-variant-translocated molybdopterin oxidoreductase [Candidatus Competibacteraceae bacterium]
MSDRDSKPLDLETIRRRLAGERGRQLWQSLEDLADEQGFRQLVEREMPELVPFWEQPVRRREVLKVAAAGLALAGVTACGRQPPEHIVPYVRAPETVNAGQAQYFASVLTHGGYARGVLVESHTGRPTKVEGNPDHPASLGATDIFAQAQVLEIYDPDRARAVTLDGRISSWDRFQAQVAVWRERWGETLGEGLTLLTPTFTSPLLGQQIAALLEQFPRARWYQYDPVGREWVYQGARLAFGGPVEPVYDLSRAERILALDGDFLGALPGNLRYARQFADGRRVAEGVVNMNRLYGVESSPTLTGAMADHYLPLRASLIEPLARHLARQLGLEVPVAGPPPVEARWLEAAARDLMEHRGRSLIIAGEHQPPAVHLLTHALNHRLGNVGQTVAYLDPLPYRVPGPGAELAELVAAIDRGEVESLVILGGNPAYDAPVDLDFAHQLRRVPNSVHWSFHVNETARAARWHIPAAHELESWGDARAYDGTLSIHQPLIEPLFGGRPRLEMLATLLGEYELRDYQIVRASYAQAYEGEDFQDFWQRVLHLGLVPDTQFQPVQVSLKSDWIASLPEVEKPAAEGLEIRFMPDPSIYDGHFANNAWLQELPKPLTQLVWSNAALIGPATALELELDNRDRVVLAYRDRALEAPVYILPGHPEGSVSLYLGYGRTHAGRLGGEVGVNAYQLRTHDRPWFDSGLTLIKALPEYETIGGLRIYQPDQKESYVTTQQHWRMEGRHMVRHATLEEFLANPDFLHDEPREKPPEHSLYPEFDYSDDYKWGMAIDLNACIGCNACTIACQAENNIPSVGRQEVERGHEMHWIRVDRYYQGPLEAPRTFFQPVPCMHCEKAPCEYVCPVMA